MLFVPLGRLTCNMLIEAVPMPSVSGIAPEPSTCAGPPFTKSRYSTGAPRYPGGVRFESVGAGMDAVNVVVPFGPLPADNVIGNVPCLIVVTIELLDSRA